MLIRDFLNLLLDDTLEEARLRHRGPEDRLAFQGAERGVEDSRRAMTGEQMRRKLRELLEEARASAEAASGRPDEAFWFSRELHVEWIAKVISVVLLTAHVEVIVTPSREAALKAAQLMELDPG
ncbi:hypothetical protein E0493_09145 [Roseomonas sp. M0104]|uniref:Uncharacterized protein n=1 Tax=Teichococcus coralli TaxID=2545983 RepID=A0A845B7A1_9PROT|nr:hypothetical protein [Pseudoroseomonas coralli]MXP63513.1 hypothetical protein [Pseudoroseomonas coralli]